VSLIFINFWLHTSYNFFRIMDYAMQIKHTLTFIPHLRDYSIFLKHTSHLTEHWLNCGPLRRWKCPSTAQKFIFSESPGADCESREKNNIVVALYFLFISLWLLPIISLELNCLPKSILCCNVENLKDS
jgi:hypothetical protein